ncbi:type I-E CRISPR-associated protein Cas5/CasD [Knoellia koreensis]|uniref:Type I-E CRISPR-associated protein Cas5/CasD n=1 Tax=Knoellia koreensis TaxID=2730921 RepID=A0A849HG93_9MICO|nr:type I-E CRISPR-associated protein Cas5/CasD [Knoellia sp. DB2414S]NNM46438.1 type I-E CRISPR-associated protein Cas5/CasD [Knoellia sp. DB2414S]
MAETSLVLRLAGPLQSWGARSQFNRRETQDRPTKSGVIGLLAAAQGRRRADSIEDLVGLRLAVRVDQPGSLLRDYHTVSDIRGVPLLSASTNAKGRQTSTSPKKFTHVTSRYYVQDAVFVAVVEGPRQLLEDLALAVLRPAYPLALGRRSCPPARPLLVTRNDNPDGESIWPGAAAEVVLAVPWQASESWQNRQNGVASMAYTVDDPEGMDVVSDVPVSFDPQRRQMVSRRVQHGWVTLTDGRDGSADARDHDPFALLGW